MVHYCNVYAAIYIMAIYSSYGHFIQVYQAATMEMTLPQSYKYIQQIHFSVERMKMCGTCSVNTSLVLSENGVNSKKWSVNGSLSRFDNFILQLLVERFLWQPSLCEISVKAIALLCLVTMSLLPWPIFG